MQFDELLSKKLEEIKDSPELRKIIEDEDDLSRKVRELRESLGYAFPKELKLDEHRKKLQEHINKINEGFEPQ